jgi:hypothetical protein
MTSPEKAGPSVVMVHHAHAYGSSWSEMIKLLHGAGITGKTWREAVELNRARLKEPAMSSTNNESSDARDRCSAQCHAPPAVTTGSPGG